jgi:UDP-glucose 4-epimerase
LYEDKLILMSVIWITGGYGFIGLELANYCLGQSDEVYGIGHATEKLNTAPNTPYKYWLTSDIDVASIEKLKRESGLPDVIYHLAGGASVGLSMANPRQDFERTVNTSSLLLEWVRLESPKTRVVCTSSAAVYGSGFDGPIDEEMTGNPYSPYGIHKAMQESLCHSYIESYDLNLSVVRLFSVYGSGLKKQLLWDLCNKLKVETGDVTLHGSGAELRDWLHITDAVRLLRQVGNLKSNIVVNGGTGVGTSISEIAEMVRDAWGKQNDIKFSGLARQGDPVSLLAATQFVESLGFSYEMDLATGINEVVNWYKETQL